MALEVKAAARIPGDQLRPLRKLRDAVGSVFVASIVISLGSRSHTFEDRLHVMPADRLRTP